ncbi:MAG: hypothetical protein OEZ22_08995 [Spirochaetia bacterium]|nr:hypothetical protein [Spirochaetia bacterium]
MANNVNSITVLLLWQKDNPVFFKNLEILSLWQKKNKKLNLEVLIFYHGPILFLKNTIKYPEFRFWRLPEHAYKNSLRIFKTIYSKCRSNILIFVPNEIIIYPRDILHLANHVSSENHIASFPSFQNSLFINDKKFINKYSDNLVVNFIYKKTYSTLSYIFSIWRKEQMFFYNSFYLKMFSTNSNFLALNLNECKKLWLNLNIKEKKSVAKTLKNYFNNKKMDYKFFLYFLSTKYKKKIAKSEKIKSRLLLSKYPIFNIYRQIFNIWQQGFYFQKKMPSLLNTHFLIPVIQISQIILIILLCTSSAKAVYILFFFLIISIPFFYQNLNWKNPFKLISQFIVRFFVYLLA